MADDLRPLMGTSGKRKGQFKKPSNPSIVEMEEDNHSIRHILEASKHELPFQQLLPVSTRKAETINQSPEQRQEDSVKDSATGKELQRASFLDESESVSDNLQIASTHGHTTVASALLRPFCSSVTRRSSRNDSSPLLRRPSALGKTLLCSEDDVIQITYESTLDDHRDDIPCDCEEFHCMSDADYFGLNDEDEGPQSTLFLMPEDAIYSAGDASDTISEPESGVFEKLLHELPPDASAEKSPFECVLRSQSCDKGDIKSANTKHSSSNVIAHSSLKNREPVDPPEERDVSPLFSEDDNDESPLLNEMKIYIIEDECGIDLEWAKKSGSVGNTDMSKSHTGSSCSEIQSKSLDSDDDQEPSNSSESTVVNSDEQKRSITGQSGASGMSDTASAQSVEISRDLAQKYSRPQQQREGELRNYLPFMNAPILFSSISTEGSESGCSTYSNETGIECASESHETERLPSPSYTVTPVPSESESEMTSLNRKKDSAHRKTSFLTMWSSSSSPSLCREAKATKRASDFMLLSPVDDSALGVDSFDVYSGMPLALKPTTKNQILSDDNGPSKRIGRCKDGSGSLYKDRGGYTSASHTDIAQCRQQGIAPQANHGGSDTTASIKQEFSLQREERQSEARDDFALQFEGSIDARSHIKILSSSVEHVSAGEQLIKDGDSKESSSCDGDLPSFAPKRQRAGGFCEQSSCKKQNLTISPCGTLHQQINSAADPRKIDHGDVSVYTPRGLQYDGKPRFLSKETRKMIAKSEGDEITTTFSDVNGTYYDVSTQPSDDTSSSEIRTRRPSPRNQEQCEAMQDVILTRQPEKHATSRTSSDVNGTPCEISWQSSDEWLQGKDQMTSTNEETNREKTQCTIRGKIYEIETKSPLSNGNSQFSDKLALPEMDHNTDNDHQVEVFIANNRVRIGMADIPERHPDTVFSSPTAFFDPMSDAGSNAESRTLESDFQRTLDVKDVALSEPYPLTKKRAQQSASSVEEDFVSSLVRKVQSYDAQMIASRTKRQLDRTAQTYERFASVPLSETKDDIPNSYTKSSIIRKLSPTNRSLFTMMSGSFSASISSTGTSASSKISLSLPTEENRRSRSSEEARCDKNEKECSLSEPEHDFHVDQEVLYNADTARPINLASSSETLICHPDEGINTTYRNDLEGSPCRTDNLAVHDVPRASHSFEAAAFGELSRDGDEQTKAVKPKDLTPASQPYQKNAPMQTRTSIDECQAEMDKSRLDSYGLSTTNVQTPSDQNGRLGQDSDDSKCSQETICPTPSTPARNLNVASPEPLIVSDQPCSLVAEILSQSEHEKYGFDDAYSVAATFDTAEKLKPSQIISSSSPKREGDRSESSFSHVSNRDVDTDIIASDSILSSQSRDHMEASGSTSGALSNISKSSMESFIDIISVHQESESIDATEDERERASEVPNGEEYTGSLININKLSFKIWQILNKLRFAPHSVPQRSSLTEPLLPHTADESSHEQDTNSDDHGSVGAMVVSQASLDHTNNDNDLDLAEQGGEEPPREVIQHREGHFCQRALRMCCCRLHRLLWSLVVMLIFLGLTIIVSA